MLRVGNVFWIVMVSRQVLLGGGNYGGSGCSDGRGSSCYGDDYD